MMRIVSLGSKKFGPIEFFLDIHSWGKIRGKKDGCGKIWGKTFWADNLGFVVESFVQHLLDNVDHLPNRAHHLPNNLYFNHWYIMLDLHFGWLLQWSNRNKQNGDWKCHKLTYLTQ